MAHLSAAAAGVVAALFFLLFFGCAASFRATNFRVYLLLGLSNLFRGLGYSFRAATINTPSDGYSGAYLALGNAGFGLSLAVISLLLGVWWKNSAAGARLRWLSVGSRLLIAPIIILGPIGGSVLAGLLFGYPDSAGVQRSALHLRHAVVYGMLGIVVTQLCIALLAASLAWQAQRAQLSQERPKGLAPRDPDLLVLVIVAACVLLLWAGIFRVVAAYHPSDSVNDHLLYPLQILPEYLEVLLLLWPLLMPRASLGRRFPAWWQLTHGRPPPSGNTKAADAPQDRKNNGAGAAAGQFQTSADGRLVRAVEAPPPPV